jgi:hypothetical protein
MTDMTHVIDAWLPWAVLGAGIYLVFGDVALGVFMLIFGALQAVIAMARR